MKMIVAAVKWETKAVFQSSACTQSPGKPIPRLTDISWHVSLQLIAEMVWGLKYFWRKRGGFGMWEDLRSGNVGFKSSLRGVLTALWTFVLLVYRNKRSRCFLERGNAPFLCLPFCPRVVVSKNLTVRSCMESTAEWAFFCHSSSSFLRLSTRRGPRRSVSSEIWWGGQSRSLKQVKRTLDNKVQSV